MDFSIDGLARRVQQAQRNGLRVLVRVAYDRQQALPPTGDEVALEQFLGYCERLARDARLHEVYGYVIGAGFNSTSEHVLAPDAPTTPEWYARVFNGYGLASTRTDNVVQIMHAIEPRTRILVGAITPWSTDQNGSITDPLDTPWLNYMNTLVARLDDAARVHAAAGLPLAGPDGFALRAAGRIDMRATVADQRQEPARDQHIAKWGQAQMGFRVYRDWLTIINRYPTTRGLPAYITATNTVTDSPQSPPTQTYPTGWLDGAFTEVQHESQIQSLCWFVDASLGDMWNDFSLSRHPGKLNDADAEFDQLLQR